jgi:hypothetical protein
MRKTLKEKMILEAQLRGDQELPLEYDSDESIDYLPESPSRKRVHYGEPARVTSPQARSLRRAGYRTRYR